MIGVKEIAGQTIGDGILGELTKRLDAVFEGNMREGCEPAVGGEQVESREPRGSCETVRDPSGGPARSWGSQRFENLHFVLHSTKQQFKLVVSGCGERPLQRQPPGAGT